MDTRARTMVMQARKGICTHCSVGRSRGHGDIAATRAGNGGSW